MKIIKIPLILSIISFLLTCAQNGQKSQTRLVSKEVKTTSVYVNVPSSEVHFEESIRSFNSGNNRKSAQNLREGIVAYKTETKDATGREKDNVKKSITNLTNLATKIEEGNVKEVSELESPIDEAYKYLTYLLVTQVEKKILVPKNLSETPTYFSKVLTGIKRQVRELKGDSKDRGEELVEKGERILEKLERNENVAKERIEDFYKEAKELL